MGLIKWILGEEPGLLEKIEFVIKNQGDKGAYGEWLTEYMFGNNNLKGYCKSLHNIYVPYKGRTSEIDVLLVHKKGIFVIESKNYSGWIFGNEQQRYWTQCLPNKEKNKFYNPIMQNATHINALSQYLDINKYNMKSFIVFSERCELKKIPNNTEEYIILKRDRLLRNIRTEIEVRQDIFTENEVDEIIAKLQPLTNVSQEEKEKHIEQIKNNF
ncbi:MAG: nuclease-related domain-containing protein [Acutalibacteraceae bacterium]|nr:nuclease-related domain-containing protein [Acutalibacteraceae bacterium]